MYAARRWLSRQFAKLAYWLAPDTATAVLSTPVKWEGGLSPRYQVEREIHSQKFFLYDGPDGAEAKRRYEYVVRMNEPGRMEFKMTTSQGTVSRGTYMRLV